MNIKEIIENSGLIEAFVLDQLSATERQGVECLAKTYPEIQTEIAAQSNALGKFYGAEEKQPPAFLKDKIFSQMTFAEPIAEQNTDAEPFVKPMAEQKEGISLDSDKVNFEQTSEKAGRIIPMWSKMAVAASVLLALSTLFMLNKNKGLSEEQVAMNDKLKALEVAKAEKGRMLEAFQNPDNKLINLLGTEKQAASAVAVLWNQKDNSVRLSVKNLPKPAAGQQYQLWIIGEKGPVDMGMLDNNFEGKLLSMKNVSGKPSAFAITLEKEGGVPSPTLEHLYVIGNV